MSVTSSGNECIAVEVETNIPYLYMRNECLANYTVESKDYIQGSGDQIYKYSFTDDSWTKIDSTFNPMTGCQFSVIKCTLDSNILYLRSAVDTNTDSRINITIWLSIDGFRWMRLYRVYAPRGNGYSSVYEYNGRIIISYEGTTNIMYQDITNITQIAVNSIKYLNDKITIQDRNQILYNFAVGIE